MARLLKGLQPVAERFLDDRRREAIGLVEQRPSAALAAEGDGKAQVKYASGLDLLRQTPDFVSEVREKRLERDFGGAYRYLEVLFDGHNPYIEAMERNLDYLRQVLRSVRRIGVICCSI